MSQTQIQMPSLARDLLLHFRTLADDFPREAYEFAALVLAVELAVCIVSASVLNVTFPEPENDLVRDRCARIIAFVLVLVFGMVVIPIACASRKSLRGSGGIMMRRKRVWL